MPKAVKLSRPTINLLGILVVSCHFFYVISTHNVTQEKIIIIGTCKNIEPCIATMRLKIELLGKHFKDYRVIIYENNSADHTAQLLADWAKENPKLLTISEKLSLDTLRARTKAHSLKDGTPCRMELIAYGRNQTLAKALSKEFDDFKFVLVTDLDFKVGWQVKDVLRVFSLSKPWDCIAANSISFGFNGTQYHDRYAYRDKQFPLGPELIGEEFWNDIKQFPLSIKYGSGLKKVYSAFGGIAIYKRNALKESEYSGYITKDLATLYDQIINDKIPKDHPHYLMYQKLLNSQKTKLSIQFKANSGYDLPVVCEHLPLHASMILKGHDKIYVYSDLLCRY
jgi:hypothetical protein